MLRKIVTYVFMSMALVFLWPVVLAVWLVDEPFSGIGMLTVLGGASANIVWLMLLAWWLV